MRVLVHRGVHASRRNVVARLEPWRSQGAAAHAATLWGDGLTTPPPGLGVPSRVRATFHGARLPLADWLFSSRISLKKATAFAASHDAKVAQGEPLSKRPGSTR